MAFCALIVDDESMPRRILSECVDWPRFSFTDIYTASDGDEGIDCARRWRPDLVISDIKMPRRNGIEMAFAIREFLPDCRFIFLSGYTDKEYLKGAIRLHAVNYVEKPVNLPELEAAIAEAARDLRQADTTLMSTGAVDFYQNISAPSGQEDVLPPVPQPDGNSADIREHAQQQFEQDLRERRREPALALQERVYMYFSRERSTQPEAVRQFYCGLLLSLIRAAELRNIRIILDQRERLVASAARALTLVELRQILLQATHDYFSAGQDSSTEISGRVERYLHEHFSDRSLTVQRIADDLGFSCSYLCAAYKKLSGRTLNRRLNEIRLQNACVLLRGTQAKLYEIARLSGYNDGKYFVKLFSREYGLSPKEYREEQRHET